MPAQPGHRRRPLRRLLLIALLCVLVADFFAFRSRVRSLEPADASSRADAIVVLTGGSGLRIAEGMRLLEAGQGERMLITGVNRAISAEEVANRAGGPAALYECCVDIGYVAETTRGNALETADWVRANGFGSILVVTSNYHMPRSMILLSEVMPDTELKPAPVHTRLDPDKALSDLRSFRGLVTEWAKWRVTWASALFR